MISGLRVVRVGQRGPTTDDNYAHIGTLDVTCLPDGIGVNVLWEYGYVEALLPRADGTYDVLVYDSGPTGACPVVSKCSNCSVEICGMAFQCTSCMDLFLCTQCYTTLSDKSCHDHRFRRFDFPFSHGVTLLSRSSSLNESVTAVGIGLGSQVIHVGQERIGIVQSFQNARISCSDGSFRYCARSLVSVAWSDNSVSSHGISELRTPNPIPVGTYFPSHLPRLGGQTDSGSDSYLPVTDIASFTKLLSVSLALPTCFATYDIVQLAVSRDTLKLVQTCSTTFYGGCHNDLLECCGQLGYVHRVMKEGIVRVQFHSQYGRWSLCPRVLQSYPDQRARSFERAGRRLDVGDEVSLICTDDIAVLQQGLCGFVDPDTLQHLEQSSRNGVIRLFHFYYDRPAEVTVELMDINEAVSVPVECISKFLSDIALRDLLQQFKMQLATVQGPSLPAPFCTDANMTSYVPQAASSTVQQHTAQAVSITLPQSEASFSVFPSITRAVFEQPHASVSGLQYQPLPVNGVTSALHEVQSHHMPTTFLPSLQYHHQGPTSGSVSSQVSGLKPISSTYHYQVTGPLATALNATGTMTVMPSPPVTYSSVHVRSLNTSLSALDAKINTNIAAANSNTLDYARPGPSEFDFDSHQFMANNNRLLPSFSLTPPDLPSSSMHFSSAPTMPSINYVDKFAAQVRVSQFFQTNGASSSSKVNTNGLSYQIPSPRTLFDRPQINQLIQGSIPPFSMPRPVIVDLQKTSPAAANSSIKNQESQPADDQNLIIQYLLTLGMNAIEQGPPQCEDYIKALTKEHPFIVHETVCCEEPAFNQHTLLSFAVSKCRLEIVDFLLHRGSWTVVSAFGSVLHVAVAYNDTSITVAQRCSMVKCLLKLPTHKLDINLMDNQKKTAAYLAVEKEHCKVLNILLAHNQHQINPFLVDAEGRNLLHVAASIKNEKSQWFLERLLRLFPVDLLNAQCGNDKQTALHLAVRNKQTASVNLLLDKGADPNVRNAFGDTPLHNSFPGSLPEVFQLLLEKGAAVDTKNDNEDTPLHIVMRQFQIQTAQNPNLVSEQQCNTLLSFQIDVANPTTVKFDEFFNACQNELLAVICCLLLRRPNISLPNKRDQQPIQLIRQLPNQLQNALLSIYVRSHGHCTCLQNMADIRFIPCNCVVFCGECCSRTPARMCPHCKREIERKINIVTNTDCPQYVAPAAAAPNHVAVAANAYDEEQHFTCLICLEIIEPERGAGLNVVLRCGHMFHRECLKKIQSNQMDAACERCHERAGPRKRLCPTCRKHICDGTEVVLF